ncbi:MAG: hypothetical protein JO257_23395 [Deltaproteobacteria bacterium]|nr:hypothetical protein [Deltaproteobacteria bacterium]
MGRALWLVSVLCAACVSSTSNYCSNGTVCPGGFTCDVEHDRCLLPEQTAACDGKQEADDCTVSGMPGACRSGACETFFCGDGYISAGEDCDGANLGSADCKQFGFYGSDGLQCSSSCTFDVSVCRQKNEYCGDDIVNGPELCDGPEVRTCVALGFDAGTASCDRQCSFTITDCSRFGWNPESLSDVQAFAVAGVGPSDQWAVGAGGRAMHFEGEFWNSFPTGVQNTLINAWATAKDDVWAVGQSRNSTPSIILHWDGTTWSALASPPAAEYVDVWGTSKTAMWFATTTGVLAYDGTNFTPVGTLTGTPRAMRGTSASDIWVATSEGPLMHWNGSAWSNLSPPGATVQFLDANAPNDVWAIGFVTANQSNAVVAHYTGTQWTQWISSQTIYNAVASSGPEDTWVGGVDGEMRHWDGAAWSTSTNIGASPTGLTALTGLLSLGPSEVIGVSTLNLAYRYRGQTFGVLPPLGPDPFSATPNTAMWGPETDTYVTNIAGEVWTFDGRAWSLAFTLPQTAGNRANDVWGSGTNNVYVAGQDGSLYHFTGGTWTPEAIATVGIDHVWGSSSADVWAFAANTAFHKNGAMWDPITIPGPVLSVSGTSATDTWIVTSGVPNRLVHWDGTAWTEVDPHASTDITAVAAVSPTDVHVSARQGRMEHFNGTTWTESIVPTLADVTYLAYTANDDVVGASARDIIHYNGVAWSNMRPPIDFVPNTLDYIPIRGLHLLPDRIDILLERYRIRTLIRTRPLICRQTETCGDGVDNDCDGKLDSSDPDCP